MFLFCQLRDLSLEHSINGQIDLDLRLCYQTKSDAVKWDDCPCSWCWLYDCENMCRAKRWDRNIKFILPPHKYTCNVGYRYLSLWLFRMISFYGGKPAPDLYIFYMFLEISTLIFHCNRLNKAPRRFSYTILYEIF